MARFADVVTLFGVLIISLLFVNFSTLCQYNSESGNLLHHTIKTISDEREETGTPKAGWKTLYFEDFSEPFDSEAFGWVLDDYNKSFDTILDDPGLWYQNDYGESWKEALASFHTYRKEFRVGKNGWLTASLSARDWNKDGQIESPPSLTVKDIGGSPAAFINVPDHTGGVILRNTEALPPEYRIEYKLKTFDFGGKRNGEIEYDGKMNGYSNDGCKTQHPWGEGSTTAGWEGDAGVPYCDWQDVRKGAYGYNGFHFLTIADFADPAPRNNHFWHLRRKVIIDAFSPHPDRILRAEKEVLICNSNSNSFYDYKDSDYATVNMWISGLPHAWNLTKGGLVSNSQWFITSCSNGVGKQVLSSAGELIPELMPDEFYTFAIERNRTGYTLEASGNFRRQGQQTFRFFRPFVVDCVPIRPFVFDDVPIWHYNTDTEEYNGRFNNDLTQHGYRGDLTWSDQWPKGSSYPDYFVIGDLYTNVYEGSASLTDIHLYVPAYSSSSKFDQCSPQDQIFFGCGSKETNLNKLTWDKVPSKYKDLLKVLGYNEKIWNSDKEEPPSHDKDWIELSQVEQEAAAELGYDSDQWDSA